MGRLHHNRDIRRICIAIPSITDFYFTRHRHTSLGAIILRDMLTEHGYEVTLIDFPGEAKKTRQATLPENLAYLEPYLLPAERGPLSFFRAYRRLGPNPDRQAVRIDETRPDVVLLSCFAFAYAEDAIHLAQAVRARIAPVPIIAGGAGPSVHPEYFLDDTAIDTVVVGSAESALTPLLEALHSGRPEMPRIIRADLDARPPLRFVSSIRNKTLTTVVTRGCPKRCRFCSVHLTEGAGFRRLDALDFARRLKGLEVDTPLEIVNFEDDNLLFDESYLGELLSALRAYNPEVELRTENGLDPEYASDRVIELLSTFGMRQLNLSLATHHAGASASEHRIPVAEYLPGIVDKARECGVEVTIYWICGLLSDTPESVVDTLHFIASLGCSSGVSPFYAVPGLPDFYDTSIFPRPSAPVTKGSSLYPWNGSLTTRQLLTTFRLSRFINMRNSADCEGNALIERCVREKRLYTIDGNNEMFPVPVDTVDGEMVARFFDVL